MRIGMILDQDFPPDIRVENEAESLVSAGFVVHILCFRYSKKILEYEDYKGILLYRIFNKVKWVKRGRALINTIFNFYTHYMAYKIKQFVIKNSIDVLHIHDLYLLGAAFLANKTLKIPIVSDLHENYVEGLKYYKFSNSFPGNLLISIRLWEKKEIEWCKKANYIITVIDEAVDRYASLGIMKDKISVVSNYVNVKHFSNYVTNLNIINRFNNKFNLLYLGGFDSHRGLESVIKAVPLAVKSIPNFELVLVGKGKNLKELNHLVKKLQITDYVKFEGFKKQEELPSYILASSLCIIPHLKTVHTDNTIPHKLFQYMLFEKPVISTNCNPLIRILSETNCGLTYKSNDYKDIANKIIKLFKKPGLRKTMGKNGKNAVINIYNWNATSKTLVDLYKRIQNNLSTK